MYRNYVQVATSRTPALVIFLINVGGSMTQSYGESTRLERCSSLLKRVLSRMVQRSTRGCLISPRYRIAIATYGGDVVDWLGGVVPIDVVASRDLPALTPSDSSNAFAAFSWAQQVLAAEPGDSECPAPLIYHFTDGHFTGDDPEPVAHEIMTMANSDGAVLVQHFYLGDDMTTKRISDVFTWPGIATSGELKSAHALKLFGMSSVYPKTFIDAMQEKGYNLRFGCRMLLPGHDIDLAELNFVMSGSTPTDLARRN